MVEFPYKFLFITRENQQRSKKIYDFLFRVFKIKAFIFS